MVLTVGTEVLDRRAHTPAVIAHIERVPGGHDLFGRRLAPYRRFVLVYSDGRWANDRTRRDLAPIED